MFLVCLHNNPEDIIERVERETRYFGEELELGYVGMILPERVVQGE